MYYELHRTDTRNLVGDYASLAEALAAVRRATEAQGDRIAESLLIIGVDDDGRPRENVAGGRELLALIHAGGAARSAG
jgi:hypothetical protein